MLIEAQSFFEDEVLSNMPNQLGPEGNKTPIWEQAKIIKITIGEAVVVPIKYEKQLVVKAEGEKSGLDLQKSSYLLIYKDKKQNMQAEWVRLAPIGEKKNDKFVGIVAVNEWNGKAKHAYAFNQNGDILALEEKNTICRKSSLRNSIMCYRVDYTNVYKNGNDWIVYGYSITYCTISYINGNGFNNDMEMEMGTDGTGGGNESNPDDYTKILDCAGVAGGTAVFSTECQTCIGGTTGIDKCPSKNPCDEVKSINQRSKNEQIKAEITELSKKPGDREYGTERKLVSLGGHTYKEPNIRSNGVHSFNLNFTWNDTDGYTIGFNHKHTVGTAPSPGDVISPFTFAYRGAVINSGHQQFYKDNLTVTTLSEGNTYVITIADWEGVKNIYEKYTVNELNIEYRKLAEEYFEANNRTTSAMQNSEYALMKQFGSTINLYKKEIGSTNYVPLRINNFESIAKNPCI